MAAHRPDLSRAEWRKSARSSSEGQNCVEVATNLPGIVAVRDSKDPDGPKLIFTSADWHAFGLCANDGELNLHLQLVRCDPRAYLYGKGRSAPIDSRPHEEPCLKRAIQYL